MSWDVTTAQGRNGAFRNLLRTVHGLVEDRAKELCGVDLPAGAMSDDAAAMSDLLYLLIREHAQYRHNIRKLLGDYYAATDQGEAMMIDNREQAAEYLAAARAEARLTHETIPRTWYDLDEAWMHIESGPEHNHSLDEREGGPTS